MGKFYVFIFFSILYFNTFSQTVSFTYSNANGSSSLCNPATINFTPVSTGNLVGYTWYFGNGQTSNSAIPSMTYATGTYIVKLVAVFSNVALETSQTITINPGVTAFLSGDKSYICKPDSIIFTCMTSTPSATFLYDFADGTPPVTSTSNTIVHHFTTFGSYNTSVRVTNAFGCSYSDSFFVEVKKPPIVSTADPASGCAPVTVTFGPTVVTVPSGSSVTNYDWSFGDGSPVSSTTTANTTHLYADSGVFLPTLNITTSEGCTNTFTYDQLNFGLAPQILYAYPTKTTYCGSEVAQFVAKSDFATYFKWEFGDGAVQLATDTSISHKYNNLGPKTVKVTPYNNECAGTPFTFTIDIVGVIAFYKYANTCSAKNKFAFTNFSQGNQSFTQWSFGDGSPDVFTINAIHTFPPSGTFTTRLTIADNITGCRDSIEFPIFTATPILTNPDTFLCRNAPSTFTVLNSYPNPSVVYNWSVLDLPGYNYTGPNPYTANATFFGSFSQNLVVLYNGNQYCPDTVRLNKTIRVGGPQLSFLTDTSSCTNNNFIITNTSSPYQASDTIKSWYWTFGIPGLNSTSYQPAVFVYSAEGTYQIKLNAKDRKGCVDTLVKDILVKEAPFLRIFPRAERICLGQTITLTGYHTDTLVWFPPSIVSCATCDTTTATPINSTKIYAIASSPNGCSLKDSAIITVFKPFTATVNPNIIYGCINDTQRVAVSPTGKKILWSSDFGLNNATIYDPIITVLSDTGYLIKLTDSADCYSSTASLKVIPYPQPVVNAGPDRVLAYNSPFTIVPIYSSDVSSYLWAPAYALNCSTCPTPSGFADTTRNFTIAVANAKGCKAKDSINISIECAYANLYMASAFSPQNISIKKYYYPQTRGIKKINRFSIYNRYGEIIYEIKNAAPNVRYNGWDGKFKGIEQGPQGFVYILEATCERGELLNKKGTFLLIR